jgi:hypothetical protein
MRQRSLAIVLSATLAAWGGMAAAQTPAPAAQAGAPTTVPAETDTPFPASQLVQQNGPQFRQAETLGRQIYVIDGAAALASTTLRHTGIDPQASGVIGWVTEPVATGILVRFVRQGRQGPEAAYDVTVDATGQAPVLARRDGAPLTPDQAGQFAAVQLALGRLDQPCSKVYAPVAFRDPGTRNWRVYALPESTQRGVFLVGGHFRFLVSPDGSRILSGGRLPPPSCLAGELTSEGHRAVALAVAEPQSPIPTELHVFLSLRRQLPLIVLTQPEGTRWLVSNGSIASVRQ